MTLAISGSRVSSLAAEHDQHLAGRGRGLGDRLGNVLRPLAGAADEHAGRVGLDRPQLRVRFGEEAELVVADVELLGQFLDAVGRAHGRGQHDQVGLDRQRLAGQRIDAADDQLAVFLGDLRDAAAMVLGAVLLDRAADELVVVLAAGADVHVEDVGLCRRAPCACRACVCLAVYMQQIFEQ